ncbi:MAG: hypothetical protein JW931_06625 [Methanomicrobiaceae archaeon]|nr:hypothetical protein [Methanomicrobiaceae archaeon]
MGKYVIIIFFILFSAISGLVFCTGCIDQPQEIVPESITINETAEEDYAVQSANPTISPAVTLNLSEGGRQGQGKRYILDTVRASPMTIYGLVPDQSMREIQVWMLDGNISASLVPVLENGTFRIVFGANQTAALNWGTRQAMVAHYPSTGGNFSIRPEPFTGKVAGNEGGISDKTLSILNNKDYNPPETGKYLCRAITVSNIGDSCDLIYLEGLDTWIEITSISYPFPGKILLSGITGLPEGSKLSVGIATVNTHPTPMRYDFTHETANGEAVVVPGKKGFNAFSCEIDISRLYTRTYFIEVVHRGGSFPEARDVVNTEIIAEPLDTGKYNYINWSLLDLPPLVPDYTIIPEMPESEVELVAPGTGSLNSEIPYGSVMYCAKDGVCRVFNESGVHFRSLYDSNAARITQVPNGAFVDTRSVGNVTFIYSGGELILTRINENIFGDRGDCL